MEEALTESWESETFVPPIPPKLLSKGNMLSASYDGTKERHSASLFRQHAHVEASVNQANPINSKSKRRKRTKKRIMKEIDASDIITTEENEKIFYSFDVDLEANELYDSEINPTEVEYEKVEWLYASNNKYPEDSVNYDKVGKWMLFIKPKWINQVWGKIISSIANGELWHSKVTTNNPNRPHHAIMIYTKDYTDLTDVIHVLDHIERTRLVPKYIHLRYKADWQTRAGIYSGGKERAWIYASETVRELVTSNISQNTNVVANHQPAHSPRNASSGSSTAKPELLGQEDEDNEGAV